MKNKCWMTFALLLVLFIPLGCKRNNDVNRVLNAYWDKGYFNSDWKNTSLSPEQWYYRMTVIDTPPNTTALSVGEGHWLHPEVIRWEITEDMLIGWRSYSSVEGVDREDSSKPYKGVPVVAFAITSHFDVMRETDTVTREASNVISENTTLSWEKRRFFRVDFSRNKVTRINREEGAFDVFGSSTIADNHAYVIGSNEPSQPKRPRFEADYFELTTRQAAPADFVGYLGAYGDGFKHDTSSPIIDMRHSFLKKGAEGRYEPLSLPNSVQLLNEQGEAVVNKKGFSERQAIWEKFGYYRTNFAGRKVWDAKRGILDENKITQITRFNIWETSYDSAGNLIPMEERTPRPIIYYTNVYHPDNLMNATQSVAAQWNEVFKEVVYHAQPGKYERIEDVPAMFIVKQNNCNIDNVETIISSLPPEAKKALFAEKVKTLSDIRKRLEKAVEGDEGQDFTQSHGLEQQAKADLEQICSALEYYTQSTSTPFRYQRMGDLRYNLVNLLTGRHPTAWSGLGPMFADPMTGETLQAVANVNLWYIDQQAARANRQIDAYMGTKTFDELVFGSEAFKYMDKKLGRTNRLVRLIPKQIALSRMDDLLSSHKLSMSSLPGEPAQVLSPLQNTRLEQKLLEPLAAEHFFTTSQEQEELVVRETPEELMDLISPLRGKDLGTRFLESLSEESKKREGVCDSPDLINRMVIGIAFQLKDLPSRERFYRIRESVYIATLLHELGHNVGLAHNMAGASDALNYGPFFWSLQELPEDIHEAIKATEHPQVRHLLQTCLFDIQEQGVSEPLTAQDCLRESEGMYSSIMDYLSLWNSDFNGLGLYDKAAIHFGYANLVEVFPRENLRLDPDKVNLRRWLFLNDWRKIPKELFTSSKHIHERRYEKWTWDNNGATSFPSNAVPYKYCMDSSGVRGPDCKAFTFGPDMRSTAAFLETQYWKNYVFTHFASDRIWDLDNQLNSIIRQDISIFSDYTNIMGWYYYYKMTDKEFSGSDAEKDYLMATVMGLNHFAHVLGHPEPGQYVTVPVVTAAQEKIISPDQNPIATTQTMLSIDRIDDCLVENLVTENKDGSYTPKAGQKTIHIPLGDGRPFGPKFTTHYEKWYLEHTGSILDKLMIPLFLAYPHTIFPATDSTPDPRPYYINWYRIFPEEVGKLMYNMITENFDALGPYVDRQGQLHHRDLLDGETLKAPQEDAVAYVQPTWSSAIPYRAAVYAAGMMSGYMSPQEDLTNSMQIALKGTDEDIRAENLVPQNASVSYANPEIGHEYIAYRFGEHPISYTLVEKANVLKERFTRLDRCTREVDARQNDPFCGCLQTREYTAAGKNDCCGPEHPTCKAIRMVPAGTGVCSIAALRERREKALEELNNAESFLDDLRLITKALR